MLCFIICVFKDCEVNEKSQVPQRITYNVVLFPNQRIYHIINKRYILQTEPNILMAYSHVNIKYIDISNTSKAIRWNQTELLRIISASTWAASTWWSRCTTRTRRTEANWCRGRGWYLWCLQQEQHTPFNCKETKESPYRKPRRNISLKNISLPSRCAWAAWHGRIGERTKASTRTERRMTELDRSVAIATFC